MKKLSMTLLICLASAGALMAQGMKYTIMVEKFENEAGWSGQWDLGDAWGAVLTDALTQSGKFIVLGEADMREAAMNEQDFAASGRTAGGNKAPQTGQMTPAQLLVKGVITAFDNGTSGGGGGIRYKGFSIGGKKKVSKITGTVYVVDSTTGMVTASYPFDAEVKSRGLDVGVYRHGVGADLGGFKKTSSGKVMAEACEEVVDFLDAQVESIQWSGTVITGGDKIIVNRGTREGVWDGQVFRYGAAEEIRDPDTGELLATDFTELGRMKVTRVLEKIAYCEVVSGKPPKKGQTFVPAN